MTVVGASALEPYHQSGIGVANRIAGQVAQCAGQIVRREELVKEVLGRELSPFDRSIDIRVARIRRKIELDPTKPEVIKTIHGVGYMFVSSDR